MPSCVHMENITFYVFHAINFQWYKKLRQITNARNLVTAEITLLSTVIYTSLLTY
jgi:hypothetical protein